MSHLKRPLWGLALAGMQHSGSPMGEAMMGRHRMMEQRMDMMQSKLQMMMDRLEAGRGAD
jgi:hypothetical protein